ncbi:MAG: acetyl-CoA carboxylase biotin carboxylase subunit family protein [Casimicrobiaceae bacterium]
MTSTRPSLWRPRSTRVLDTRPIVLVLFPLDYDREAIDRLRKHHDGYEFVEAGFDLFSFPSNAQLLWFDIDRFINRLLKRFRRRQIAAVISNQEQIGALAAAVLCERLGLPGTPVAALVTAQNKAAARTIHREQLPEHTPEFCTFRFDADPALAVTLPYPVFVKPVKAAFSVLARRCESVEEVRAHISLSRFDKTIIRALTRPFRTVSPRYLRCDATADHFIAETALEPGVQLSVDGYAEGGVVHALGLVDAVMYPGTQAFRRFELPSRLPELVQARCIAVAQRAVETLGFTHGLFNVELIWHPETDRLWIVEVNPRMAGQFSDLYERVTGRSLWDIQLALALGQPVLEPRPTAFGAAASFVFREFAGRAKQAPAEDDYVSLVERFPDARLYLDLKHGAARRREERWVGSYRYALLHMGGCDHDDLLKRFACAEALLDFEPRQTVRTGFRVDWLRVLRRSI